MGRGYTVMIRRLMILSKRLDPSGAVFAAN